MSNYILDMRPIINRTKLVIMGHNIDIQSDTCSVIFDYGLDQLLCDLILYSKKYMDIPGNPHYAHVGDKLERLYKIELDPEILEFVLAELEYTLFTMYRVDTFLFTPIEANWPLLKGDLMLDNS